MGLSASSLVYQPIYLVRRHPAVRALIGRHREWAAASLWFALLTVIILGMGLLDERTFNGVSVWSKPFKFALSTTVYFATLAWFAPLLPEHFFRRPAGWLLTWLPIVCATLEVAYITVQGALGQASHFNTSTPFHRTMYTLMAFGAIGLVGTCAWFAMLLLTRYRLKNLYCTGVIIGLLLTFLLGGGFGMYLGGQEHHWVNASMSDAEGVWLFNWSTDGGDLRVAHFFGIHAMQIVPLFAYAVRSHARGLLLTVAFALGYAMFTCATFLQATSGLPFLLTLHG